MKRFIAYLLLCCSMLVSAVPARAEAPLRYAATAQELLTNWLKDTYPEITCELAFGPSSTAEALALLQDVNAPDIMMVQSNRVDIYALLQSGLLEDLSSNEKIQLGMAQIYQPFRELVSGKNGEIYGVPYAVFSQAMHAIPSSWEAAGLRLEEAPGSFEALLDFAQQWISLVKEDKVGDVRLHTLENCGYLLDDGRYTLWLTDMLMQCWAMEQQLSGKPIVFSSPEFIALADRARETGEALAAAEERPGPASLSLYDGGFHNGVGYGLEALDTYAFPMRLTEDESMRVQGNCWLFVVRKGSPYAQVCMEFLGNLLYVADPTARRNVCLYQNVAQQQFTPPEGEDGYVLVPQWMESYHPEYLYFQCSFFSSPQALTLYENQMRQFARGNITAQELAASLDQAYTIK